MKIIGGGAEALIYKEGPCAIKKRVKKRYRLKALDDALRKTRTKRESKILRSLPKEILSPRLISEDLKNMEIRMEFIPGKKIRDMLDDSSLKVCREIGAKIGIMHNAGIVHGDLTTSNMIYDGEIRFIDFGLSFFSDKVEDKAVDLHLLRQALESKHYRIWKKAFGEVIKGYKKTAKDSGDVLIRYDVVEKRGRNKAKI